MMRPDGRRGGQRNEPDQCGHGPKASRAGTMCPWPAQRWFPAAHQPLGLEPWMVAATIEHLPLPPCAGRGARGAPGACAGRGQASSLLPHSQVVSHCDCWKKGWVGPTLGSCPAPHASVRTCLQMGMALGVYSPGLPGRVGQLPAGPRGLVGHEVPGVWPVRAGVMAQRWGPVGTGSPQWPVAGTVRRCPEGQWDSRALLMLVLTRLQGGQPGRGGKTGCCDRTGRGRGWGLVGSQPWWA